QLLIKVPELFIDLDKRGFLSPRKYTDASMKFSEDFEKDGRKLSLYVPYSPLNMTHQEVQFDVGPEGERNNPRVGNGTAARRARSASPRRKASGNGRKKGSRSASPRRKASGRRKSASARQGTASPRRRQTASPRRRASPRR